MTDRFQLRNIRTGETIGEFTDFIAAWNHRRDVLTPRLANPWKNPWHIHDPDDPDYLAAQAAFEAFRRDSEARIAALPKRAVQGELFPMLDFLKVIS